MKHRIAYNCDFLQVENGCPLCMNPKLGEFPFYCHPFDLACDDASFEKIFSADPLGRDEVPVEDKKCILCVHFCQAQVYSYPDAGKRCGDHERSKACEFKKNCKAKIHMPGTPANRYGFCILHNKEFVWFKSCPDFMKRGDHNG